MGLDDSTSTGVKGREHSTTMAAMMITILERTDQIGNASETAAEANDGRPGTVLIVSPHSPTPCCTVTYCVVLPETASTLVIALV